MTATILLIVYISLRLTSDYPGFEQRQAIERAIAVIETRGFSREGFVLKYLATFRTSDNWWNIQTGHKEAYAATNFPFEVVTLYPEFFNVATDDTERAAILLHETKHMLGSGEEGALRATWAEKEKLGWTADKYSQTKVWENTRDLTKTYAPELIVCDQSSLGGCAR
jgi:hypothetical protein